MSSFEELQRLQEYYAQKYPDNCYTYVTEEEWQDAQSKKKT